MLAGLKFEKPNETHWPKESALAIRYFFEVKESLRRRTLFALYSGSPTSQINENVKLDFSYEFKLENSMIN